MWFKIVFVAAGVGPSLVVVVESQWALASSAKGSVGL